MEQDRYYFRVGLFVSIVIAAAIYVLGWFASNQHKETRITYAIYFEGSVNGLSRGSPVKYKGIEVGNVLDIGFASYENDLIQVLVDIVDTAPVRKDTKASLQMQGITGTSIVSLENTNKLGEPVEYLAKEEGEEYMVIGSEKSGLEKVFTSVPELIEELTKLGIQGQKLLSDDNINNVNLMMTELRSLLAEGKITMREIKMLSKTLREDPSQVLYGPKYKGYEVEK